MSQAVLAVLQKPGVLPKNSSELSAAIHASDGYEALHSIMRMHHPRLVDHGIPLDKPKQKADEDFVTYVARVLEYGRAENYALQFQYTDRQLVELAVRNSHPWYQSVFHTHILTPIYAFPPSAALPIRFTLAQLGTMMQTLWQLYGSGDVP